METTELRIGNLVLCDRNRIVEFWGVTEGHNKFILNYKNGSGIYYNDIDIVNPIPLTEELIINLGFKKHKRVFYELNEFMIGFKANSFWFITSGLMEIELKTVHQLQNLYFALTGEELKMNQK